MPARKKNSLRTWLRTRPGRLTQIAILGALTFGAYWYNEHRKIGWLETFSPSYWWRRVHGMDLYHVDQALLTHGHRDRREVALTFDDGPHRLSRPELLDILKRYGAHATFFDVGRRMAENPELVRRTLAEGHEIANHTQNHLRLPGLSEIQRHREINDADITFCRITGQHLSLLRPPGMQYNAEVLADTKRLGYIVVGYTTASRDFDLNETPEFIADRTVRRTEPGSIVLLHDYPTTVHALPAILERLRNAGFQFVTVSEMIRHLPAEPRLKAQSFQEIFSEPEVRLHRP